MDKGKLQGTTDWKNQIDRQIHHLKFTSYTSFVSKAESCRTSSFGEHSLPVLLPSHKQRNGPLINVLLCIPTMEYGDSQLLEASELHFLFNLYVLSVRREN